MEFVRQTEDSMKLIAYCLAAAMTIATATTNSAAVAAAKPKGEPFGKTDDGTPVEVFTLTNAKGIKLRAMTYGAIVLSLETPDRAGKSADIVLGYRTLADYIKSTPYFGAIVGRYGNRIAQGKFKLDGKEHSLATNNTPGGMPCALHGGLKQRDGVSGKNVSVHHFGLEETT